MLKEMRGFTRSWFARGLLVLLAVLMSITITQRRVDFENIISSIGGPRGVAAVAGYDISGPELTRELQNALRSQRQQGHDVTQEQAVQQGAHLQLLQGLIEQHAAVAYAEKLGIHAGVRQVADAIYQLGAVRTGVGGGFDRDSYLRLLQNFGYSEPEFTTLQRGQIETNIMAQAMTAGLRAPTSFGKLALAFESESRTISMAEAPASLVGTVAPPTPAQLQTFYQDNAERLRLPEYRALTLVYARPGDFAARVNVPEDQIRAEFERRRAGLTQPEKRSYWRIAATSEQQAHDAAARIARGEAPDAVAHAMNLQAVHSENQTRAQAADIAAAVFSTPANSPPKAVPAQLTPWAVIKVESVTPAVEPVYENERAGIRDAIARDTASDQLNEAEQAFMDARGGGMNAVDAGRAHGLTVVAVPAVDSRGLTPEGQPAAALVDQADLLRTAFGTSQGDASDFISVGDGDAVVAVDHITPATVRTLDSVRPQLTDAWIGQQKAQRLQQIGQAVIADVAHGQSFANVVRARHLTMRVQNQPLDRPTAARLPARELAAEIFGSPVGTAVSALAPDGSALLVAHIEAVHREDPNSPQARTFIEQQRTQVQQALNHSLIDAITAEVVKAGNPRRNETLLRQMFAPRTGDQDPANQ